jgi:hypothetical protein
MQFHSAALPARKDRAIATYATSADIGGYPKVRTRQIAPQRNAAQHSGIRAALTGEHGKRELGQGEAEGRRQEKQRGETLLVGHFAVAPEPIYVWSGGAEKPANAVGFCGTVFRESG